MIEQGQVWLLKRNTLQGTEIARCTVASVLPDKVLFTDFTEAMLVNGKLCETYWTREPILKEW